MKTNEMAVNFFYSGKKKIINVAALTKNIDVL